MKKLALFLLLFPTFALAQEPSYVYQQFGYSPKQIEAETLSKKQQSELESCIEIAKEQDEQIKKNSEKMSALYGTNMKQTDVFGSILTGCLADEKGWIVQEKVGDEWKTVTSRYAARTFMKLDPAK